MKTITKSYINLVQVCENDIQLISAVIDTMSKSFAQHIIILDDALQSWDRKILNDTLHLLKGSLSYLRLSVEADKIILLEGYVQNNNKLEFTKNYIPIQTLLTNLPEQLKIAHQNANPVLVTNKREI